MSGPTKEQIERNRRIRDSIALVEKEASEREAARIALDQAPAATPSLAPGKSDSTLKAEKHDRYRDFAAATEGQERFFTIENDLVKA